MCAAYVGILLAKRRFGYGVIEIIEAIEAVVIVVDIVGATTPAKKVVIISGISGICRRNRGSSRRCRSGEGRTKGCVCA